MKIYDELTKEVLTDPDLSAGYVYEGMIVTGRTEERIEVMEGTVTPDRPEGLRRRVPAQDITEACGWYHAYTEEELAAMQPGSGEGGDEGGDEGSAAAIWDELAAAYNEGVMQA